MLTQEGCQARRDRLWTKVAPEIDRIVIHDPAHLSYLANFCPSPFVFNSQSAGAMLILGRDGSATLVADNVQDPFLEKAFASEKLMPVWYRCVESAGDRAELLIKTVLERLTAAGRSSVGIEAGAAPAALVEGLRAAAPRARFADIGPALREMRRAKDPDELRVIRQSLGAATAALEAAMRELEPGMTELDAYRLVERVASEKAGRQVLVYGDFVSGPRCEKIGGPPSARTIEAGDLMLLDFSVVIDGYRGDFCNTFVCGGSPDARRRELYEACTAAMQAGEQMLRPRVPCREVHAAVRDALAKRRLAEFFPHHSGHGVGLGHPEPPFLVPESSEVLSVGDVVTLEPGVYLPGVAGMRYERNYVITENGYESLSQHPIEIEVR